MTATWIYALLSVSMVSLVSLIGVTLIALSRQCIKQTTFLLISLATGAMLGNAFIHLLPEAFEGASSPTTVSLLVLAGIFTFFVLEKALLYRHCSPLEHCHAPHQHKPKDEHVHPVGYMSLFADGMENLVDGMAIGAAYLVDFKLGVATTMAIVLHEIPTEMGDFGVLMHAGFSRTKALLVNLGTALLSVVGALIALAVGSRVEHFPEMVAPFAAGCFIYIAVANLVPELHKELKASRSVLQLLAMVFGVALMLLLTYLE